MAANGITLAPIRMGDLVSSSVAKSSSKYMPPSKRTGSDGKTAPVLEKIDMSDKSFPSLGAVPVKVASWGKHVIAKPVAVAVAVPVAMATPVPEVELVKKATLSDKIKEKMRLDAIAEELGAGKEELDPWKMSDAQLEKAGWVRLRLSSAKDICMKGFTNQVNPYLPGFIEEADSGMSFEEYMHYKLDYKKPELAVSPRKTNTPEVQYEDYSEDEDDEN
jgi:hypothetical protein